MEVIKDVSGKTVMVIYADRFGRYFTDHNGSKVYLPPAPLLNSK